MTKQQQSNILPIAVMFCLFFMIAFVTNFAGSMGVIVKEQFEASNLLSQLGTFANFIAYACMGVPAGIILKRKGYKFTSLTAVTVGFVGVGIQWLSGYVDSQIAFAVYVGGALISGFSMCMLNIVVNPMLNTLGGGGNRGNQLVQLGGSCNSIGGTIAPILLGYLIGGNVQNASVSDAAPAMISAMAIFLLAFIIIFFTQIPEPHLETEKQQKTANDDVSPLAYRHFVLGAIAIFFYVGVEVGIPNMANLYMSNNPLVGAAIAGTIVGLYWLMMMFGRLIGGSIGGKVSSRQMLSAVACLSIVMLICMMFFPETWNVTFADDFWFTSLAGKSLPVSMIIMFLCGLCTSVMWGAIFNLATEGLGKATPAAAGIFMAMVCGGGIIPLLQGFIADNTNYLLSYIVPIIGLSYILWYALFGSKPKQKAEK